MEPAASTPDHTRRRYLDLAAELARSNDGQPAYPYAVSAVTLAETAAALGIARSTLYKQWPSKFDFWDDLIVYMAERRLAETRPTTARRVVAAAGDREEAIRRLRGPLSGTRTSVQNDPWSVLRNALLGYPDSEQVTRLVSVTTASAVGWATYHVDEMFAALRLEPVWPITSHHIAAFVYCVLDGIAYAGRLTPVIDVPDIVLDEGEPWGLFDYTVRCVLRRFGRPVPDGAPVPAGRPPSPAHVARAWTPAQRAALAAAAQLFDTKVRAGDAASPDGPLGQVTIARLARRAGVTRQAVHLIWPNQPALRDDLVRHLFAQRSDDLGGLLEESLATAPPIAAGQPWLAAAERLFTRRVDLLSRWPDSYLAYAPQVRAATVGNVAREHTERTLADGARVVEAALSAAGHRTRPGVRSTHLAALLLATASAFGRLYRTNPELAGDTVAHAGGQWSVMSILMDGVISDSVVRAN